MNIPEVVKIDDRELANRLAKIEELAQMILEEVTEKEIPKPPKVENKIRQPQK